MSPNKCIGVAKRSFCATLLSCLAISSTASAATIAPLYNTGVDNAGNALVGAGVPDPHYSLIVQPGSATAVTVDHTSFPIAPNGPWVANNPFSRWIGPDQTSQGPPGNYTYRTTFNVPANANLSTVNISGMWDTDDGSIDIVVGTFSIEKTAGGWVDIWLNQGKR